MTALKNVRFELRCDVENFLRQWDMIRQATLLHPIAAMDRLSDREVLVLGRGPARILRA